MGWRTQVAIGRRAVREVLRGMAEGIQSQSGREAIRRRAGVVSPQSYGTGPRARDTWGFKVATPGDMLNHTAEQREAMARAARMWGEVAILRQMHSKRAAFVTGAGKVRLTNVRSQRVQDLADRTIRDRANTIFNRQRQDYIRWQLFGMSPYLAQPRPNGVVRLHWWSPLNFDGLTCRSGNDALPDTIVLKDSRVFVEGRYSIVNGRRVENIPTNFAQDPYCKGMTSVHRVIDRRDRPESSRSTFDVMAVDPRRDPVLDGTSLVFIANQVASSLGEPGFVATFNDISKKKQVWEEVVLRTQQLLDKVWVYHYKTLTPEITRMINEGWEPRPGETLFSQFDQTPEDTEKLSAVAPDIKAVDLNTFFGRWDREIILDSGMPLTWFSNPEDRVLAAIAQESPTVKDLAAWQAEWIESQTLAMTYCLETAQMMTDAVALTDDLSFEIEPEPLRAEDAAAVYDRLSKLAGFLLAAQATGTPRQVATLVIREAMDKENVIEVERYMDALGLPHDALPPPAEINPMLDAATNARETFDAVAARDPEGLASLIPGMRTLHPDPTVLVGSNGHR